MSMAIHGSSKNDLTLLGDHLCSNIKHNAFVMICGSNRSTMTYIPRNICGSEWYIYIYTYYYILVYMTAWPQFRMTMKSEVQTGCELHFRVMCSAECNPCPCDFTRFRWLLLSQIPRLWNMFLAWHVL